MVFADGDVHGNFLFRGRTGVRNHAVHFESEVVRGTSQILHIRFESEIRLAGCLAHEECVATVAQARRVVKYAAE